MAKYKSKKNPAKYKLTFLPFKNSIDVPAETTILEAARQLQLPLKASCGGKGTCGDCLVRVLAGSYQAKPSAVLSPELINKGYTLACQTKVRSNLRLQLPQFEELKIKTVYDSKFFEENKEKISGQFEINPPLKRIELSLPQPSLDDNYSDLKRLQRELQKKTGVFKVKCEYGVLKKLSQTIRRTQGKISVFLSNLEPLPNIIDVRTSAESQSLYGLAIDIGTTTVVLHLVDLENGKILETVFSYNQQLKCGQDIIARINYAQKPGCLQELQQLIILTLNTLIDKAISSSRVSFSDIYFASVAGNTTMIHLFLKLEPNYIRLDPYVPTINQVPIILSRDLGLKMNGQGRIYCAPSVGSYVGGDITAGLLSTPLYRNSQEISLFIDAGTNGELVIGNRDWLMTCACSIGPAFEGSGIRCGMPATAGAIENLKIKPAGKLEYKVINGGQPKGICGSGLVDLLAELFCQGYVDRHGKFILAKDKERFKETENGLGFLIEKATNCYWGKDLYLTENDISNLLRSKAAVYSACSLLLKKVGLDFNQVDNIYL
ncbi:MAG: ASKHA domain-containing protein, partial [Candidatus Aminicenantales bacterium]